MAVISEATSLGLKIAADGSPELIAAQRRLVSAAAGIIFPPGGIETRIAEVVVGIAVPLIGARLGDGVEHASQHAAILRAEGIG